MKNSIVVLNFCLYFVLISERKFFLLKTYQVRIGRAGAYGCLMTGRISIARSPPALRANSARRADEAKVMAQGALPFCFYPAIYNTYFTEGICYAVTYKI